MLKIKKRIEKFENQVRKNLQKKNVVTYTKVKSKVAISWFVQKPEPKKNIKGHI